MFDDILNYPYLECEGCTVKDIFCDRCVYRPPKDRKTDVLEKRLTKENV